MDEPKTEACIIKHYLHIFGIMSVAPLLLEAMIRSVLAKYALGASISINITYETPDWVVTLSFQCTISRYVYIQDFYLHNTLVTDLESPQLMAMIHNETTLAVEKLSIMEMP